MFDSTHMMIITNDVVISVEIPKVACGYYLKEEFTKLVCLNPLMLLYLTINYIDLFYSSLCGPLI